MLQIITRVAVYALALSLGASGCSDSSGDHNLSCDLAPASEVGATLGLTGLLAPVAGIEFPGTAYAVTSCSYGLGNNSRTVIINFDAGTDAEGFAASKQSFVQAGVPVTDVSGLGEAAYFCAAGTQQVASNTLVVLKGSTSVLIPSGASRAQEEALARQILAKL
ncbi:hypothetical protein [Thiocystis minor]|uniref:hypothetical protein n=1 Tax=Thiocystis minor TaxID=61597 RepID=UPI001911A2B9|nr:hypothetical protein [Thiocystis minor]